MSPHTSLLLLITVWASVQDGLGLPLTKGLEEEAPDVVPPHRVRAKRCACSNQLDAECHYFCHLDIIWVNTPSKTTVYGMGSPLSRRRRSAGRCACANPADHTCTSFCHGSIKIPLQNSVMKMPQTSLLSILRAVGSLSGRVQKAVSPHGGDAPETWGQDER